jgi:hypothetical protein
MNPAAATSLSAVPRAVIATLALVLAAASARADGYLVFQDDRAAFSASLGVDPLSTVIDTGGAFAPDPTAGANLASVTRSGTIAGGSYTWVGYDINFSNAPTGTLTPGVAGGDIASATPLNVETPAAQGAVAGTGTWGLDSGPGSTTSRNALLVHFAETPLGLGIGHFGLDLLDFEASSAFTSGTLNLYRDGVLVFSRGFDWGAGDGNDESHFLGVVAVGAGWFDQVAIVVGDDTAGGGNAETWAADRFTFGQAIHAPEPGTWALTGLGVGALGLWGAIRRRGAATKTAPAARCGAAMVDPAPARAVRTEPTASMRRPRPATPTR